MKLTVLVCVLLAACGPKHKNQCPGNAAGPCAFNSEECSFDQKRGCQVCQCKDLTGSSSTMTNPDTNGLPPEPAH